MKVSHVSIVLLAMLAGCTSYYQVTDPATGKKYLTTNIKQDHGSTTLHDARTNQEVMISNSEVMKISKEQYDADLMKVPPPQ
jgi:hypothetical protein